MDIGNVYYYLYWVVYYVLLWGIPIVLIGYVLVWAIFGVATFRVTTNADQFTVNRKDPQDPRSLTGVIRELEPFEMMVIAKGGQFRHSVFQESSARITLAGYLDPEGFRPNRNSHWNITRVPEDQPFPPIISSGWSWLSPYYFYRRSVHEATGRHVIRVWFPFVTSGLYEIHSPIITDYERAVAKGRPTDRNHLVVLEPDQEDSGNVRMVSNRTDHALLMFDHDVLTASFPVRGGLSFRANVTLQLELGNLAKLFSYRTWSNIINKATSNGAGIYFRPRSLDQAYAAAEDADNGADTLQDIIFQRLTDGRQHAYTREGNVGVSVMDTLGLNLTAVILNDLVPANKETQARVEEIMSIVPEGTNQADVTKALLKAQAEGLEGVDPETVRGLAAITAAQKGSNRTDFIIGGDSRDPAALAYGRRTAQNTEPQTPNE